MRGESPRPFARRRRSVPAFLSASNPDEEQGARIWAIGARVQCGPHRAAVRDEQFNGGESTLSYLAQMAAIAVQIFVTAAVGMAVLAASCAASLAARGTSSATSGSISIARSSTHFAMQLGAVAMTLGRYVPLVAALALAGSLGTKKSAPPKRRNLPDGWGDVHGVAHRSDRPDRGPDAAAALTLGPIVEGLGH
ncbi:MAG TPA: potassium-transporting ATPase subunit KdpA [Gaiellaceae bacterium]|nr:potassium-transporting ATPase subunit KdpA [Gaiellaceae bacterium]